MANSRKPNHLKNKKSSDREDDFKDFKNRKRASLSDLADDDNSFLDAEPDLDLVKKSDASFLKGLDPFDDEDDDDF
jgi:hypothetical protein